MAFSVNPEGSICSECGEIVLPGLMSHVNHSCSCKKDAPNCDIENYRWAQEQDKLRKEREVEINKRLSKLSPCMTEEEKLTLSSASMCGMVDYKNNTVLMGREAFERYFNYIDTLSEKYLKPITEP